MKSNKEYALLTDREKIEVIKEILSDYDKRCPEYKKWQQKIKELGNGKKENQN